MNTNSLDTQRETIDGLQRRERSRFTVWGIFTLCAACAVLLTSLLGHPDKVVPLGLALGAVAVVWFVAALRRTLRDRIEDDLFTLLPTVLGLRGADRRLVRCRQWTGGFIGHPSKITVAHSAANKVGDPAWELKVRSIIAHVIPGMKVSIAKHPRKHLTAILTLGTPEDLAKTKSTDPHSEQKDRIGTMVGEIFGATEEVKLELDPDTGEPQSLSITHNKGNQMSLTNRRRNVERMLSAQMRGAYKFSWDLPGRTMTMTRRPPLPKLALPPAVEEPPVTTQSLYDSLEVPIGVAEGGELVTWSPKNQSHALIIGPTNSGKTVIEHQIIEYLAQRGCKIWLCDGKRIEFMGFRHWPNVEMIAARTEHKIRMIRAFFDEMNRRYDGIEAGTITETDLEPIFLVTDEAATLLKQSEIWYADIRAKAPVKGMSTKIALNDWLGDVARLGRSAKMHLITGLQRPDTRFIEGEMRDNYAFRASVGKLGSDGAQMFWDNANIGASASPVKGRGWSTTRDGRIVETQFFFAPNPDITRSSYEPTRVANALPLHTRHTPKHLEIIEPEKDLDTGEIIPIDYPTYMDAQILDGPDPNWRPFPDHHALAEAAETDFAVDDGDAVEPAAPRLAEEAEGPVADEGVVDAEEDGELYADQFQEHVLHLDPTQVRAGDLVLADEGLGLWAVVESVDDDPAGITIDMRHMDTGEPDSLTLDESASVAVRRPHEQEEGEEA